MEELRLESRTPDADSLSRQLHNTRHALGERVKELTCLYTVSTILFEHPNAPVADVGILQRIVDVIAPAWQYPERTCVRIEVNDLVVQSSNWSDTPWALDEPIKLDDSFVGHLRLRYLLHIGADGKEAFLDEERILLATIASYLGKALAHRAAQERLHKTAYSLRERNKELNCLHQISQLFDNSKLGFEHIVQGLVELILPAWQYPDITCASIAIGSEIYESDNWQQTPWCQHAPLNVEGIQMGQIRVGYLEEPTGTSEGLFLPEERNLLNSIAQLLTKFIEKSKSDNLILKILPESVARQLRYRNEADARYFDSVTVLFSDVVGFTPLCAKHTPFEVVSLLNRMYILFDQITDRYGLYKIETIGDAYMVVGGIPEADPHGVEKVADMALDMLEAMRDFRVDTTPDSDLVQVRIGIHTGPVVGGVVGTKVPLFSVYGDTVNTASRIESTSLPMCINVSPNTHEYLVKHTRYRFEERQQVELKGKGKTNTYLLYRA